jgi:hypothetical protein
MTRVRSGSTARRSSLIGAADRCATSSSPELPAGLEGRLRRRHLHRVHGATRPGPHGARRQDLSKGPARFQADIAAALAKLDFLNDPQAYDKREALKSFDISCDAVILFAERHARTGARTGRRKSDPQRRPSWKRSPKSAHVPAHAPARFPGSAAVLLVLPPRGDHRTQRLGLVQPRPSRSASAAVLRARAWRMARSRRKAPASCSSASSSSSTTIPRRPRSG